MNSSPRHPKSKTSFLLDAWYQQAPWLRALRPLSCFVQSVSKKRRDDYLKGKKVAAELSVPVVIVGNITVGGTGKTPLVIAIVSYLRRQGFKPGVISRGYSSKAPHYPFVVTKDSDPEQSGDEPLLIASRAQCPVVIDPDRVCAAKKLIEESDCDVIISDDGLQHYRLTRQVEICVIDAQRGLGNKQCLPEGPLREPVERLADVDFVVVNGLASEVYGNPQFEMTLMSGDLVAVGGNDATNDAKRPTPGDQVNAIAGIGNPERFFSSLESNGYKVCATAFGDHHHYQREDFNFSVPSPVLMTEKDAVKCAKLGLADAWYLPVEAQLPEKFWQLLLAKLKQENTQKKGGS